MNSNSSLISTVYSVINPFSRKNKKESKPQEVEVARPNRPVQNSVYFYTSEEARNGARPFLPTFTNEEESNFPQEEETTAVASNPTQGLDVFTRETVRHPFQAALPITVDECEDSVGWDFPREETLFELGDDDILPASVVVEVASPLSSSSKKGSSLPPPLPNESFILVSEGSSPSWRRISGGIVSSSSTAEHSFASL